MSLRGRSIVGVVAACWVASTWAGDCPPVVKDAALKAHPGASVTSCKQETEDGRVQYEVKLADKAGGKVDVDVSPEGKVLQTEEPVALDAVPQAVMHAMQAGHAGAKTLRAEKQTDAAGSVTYEIAFEAAGKKQESTYAADGTPIEEEGDDGPD